MRLAPVVLLALLLALALPATAFAHAEPSVITPGDGAVLTSPPAQIQIEMSQDMARRDDESGPANDIDVIDATGAEITTTSAVIDNGNRRQLTVAMPRTLEPGVYTVQWKTLSDEDGDDASGEFTFTYDPAGTADPGTEQVREDVLGGQTPTPDTSVPGIVTDAGNGDGGGTSWVLVAAVAVGMLVLGSGGTFLLVQRRQ